MDHGINCKSTPKTHYWLMCQLHVLSVVSDLITYSGVNRPFVQLNMNSYYYCVHFYGNILLWKTTLLFTKNICPLIERNILKLWPLPWRFADMMWDMMSGASCSPTEARKSYRQQKSHGRPLMRNFVSPAVQSSQSPSTIRVGNEEKVSAGEKCTVSQGLSGSNDPFLCPDWMAPLVQVTLCCCQEQW